MKQNRGKLLTYDADPRVSLNRVNKYFSNVGDEFARTSLLKLDMTESDLAKNLKSATLNTSPNSFFLPQRRKLKF